MPPRLRLDHTFERASHGPARFTALVCGNWWARGEERGSERLRARDHASDGKNVRGVAPESVHARYAAEVCELREQLTRRAGECGISVPEWHEMSADAAMQRIAELLV